MSKSKLFAPIVLFTYNRVEHVQRTVDALKKNEFSKESDLIVFSDGSKNENANSKVNDVRNYLKTISGFKTIQIYEQNKNFGLAKSIITGVTKVINEYGRAIILEDDLETSPFFLKYMNDALMLYEDEEEVISIHGYVYPIKTKLPETFFIKIADCWGWATWKRGWDLFQDNGSALLNKISSLRNKKEFDFNNSYPFVEMLKDQIKGKNSSWAIRWYASAFVNNKLTLYPGRSLVQNIGNDNTGTHCKFTNKYLVDVANSPIVVDKIELIENASCRKIIELFFKSLKGNIIKRVANKMIKFISFIYKRGK